MYLYFLMLNKISDQLKFMYEKSPIRNADEIVDPLLLLVGKNDRRVSPSQSLELYHTLKGLGKPVELNLYEDNHSLAKIGNAANALINTALFFDVILKTQ